MSASSATVRLCFSILAACGFDTPPLKVLNRKAGPCVEYEAAILLFKESEVTLEYARLGQIAGKHEVGSAL